jgi:hypothetical protein
MLRDTTDVGNTTSKSPVSSKACWRILVTLVGSSTKESIVQRVNEKRPIDTMLDPILTDVISQDTNALSAIAVIAVSISMSPKQQAVLGVKEFTQLGLGGLTGGITGAPLDGSTVVTAVGSTVSTVDGSLVGATTGVSVGAMTGAAVGANSDE